MSDDKEFKKKYDHCVERFMNRIHTYREDHNLSTNDLSVTLEDNQVKVIISKEKQEEHKEPVEQMTMEFAEELQELEESLE